MDDYIQLPLTATALRKWLRFSDKGGIGKAVSLADRLAESGTDELMFMEGDPIVVLMQLDNGRYLGSCEGVVGIFHEEDVRFLTKLKKPVFTKKQKSEALPPQNNVTSPSQSQDATSPKLHQMESPVTPSAMSPGQTPISGGTSRRFFSAPTAASHLLYLQDDSNVFPQQSIPPLEHYAPAGQPHANPNTNGGSTIQPAIITTSESAHPSQMDARSPSALEDNEDILSSYVYDAEDKPYSEQAVSQVLDAAVSSDTPERPSLQNKTSYISSLPHPKKEISRDASRVLAPLKINRLGPDTSEVEYLTEANPGYSSFKSDPISPRIHILPVLPAGVSLKQLRERSGRRFPLSPRSASMNDTVSRSSSELRSVQASPSTVGPNHQADQAPSIAQYVQNYDVSWSNRPQTPIASPVPSSFVSAESPRSPLSPTSPSYPEYSSLVASTSTSTFDHGQGPVFPVPLPNGPSAWSSRIDQPGTEVAYDARSLSSATSSFRGLGHSRSMSSLTRAGSLFQRRPSLPLRSDSNLGSSATDNLVELNNTQFEFVQPNGGDSEGESPHSAAESLNSSTSARLITRPSASAKERVRSIYISDSPLLSREPDRVLDKYGFIHSQHIAPTVDESDILDSQDRAALQAYRARELKWVNIMSSMSARSARTSNKVKKLVNHGIPNSVRGKAWTYLAETATRRKEGVFHEMCAKEESNEAARISEDVTRCFYDHSHFSDEDSIGRQDLCAILRALLQYLPSLQYHQGLCYIAGMLLLHTEAESAFWLLVAIVLDYLPSYFVEGRSGSSIDANIILYAIQRGEADLHRHLAQQDIKLAGVFDRWLSCAYVRTLPWASQLRVMDLFFMGEKPSQLGIRVGLAVLDLLRDNLLARSHNALRLLQSPPAELLSPALLIPSLLTIKLPGRTIKKGTKWASEQCSAR